MDDNYLDNLTERFLFIGILNRKFSNNILSPALETVSEFGIAPHHSFILKVVYEWDASTITGIGDFTGISRSQMSASIKKLENLGLIQRQPNEKDRRQVYIVLTEKGSQIVRQIDQRINHAMKSALSKLDANDLKRLNAAVETMQDILTTLDD